jgi:hypothetical protein
MNPGDKVRVKTRPERTGMVIKTEMDHGHLDVYVLWDIADQAPHRESWTFADQLEAL